MKKTLCIISLVLTFLAGNCSCFAADNEEVSYLLSYLANSGCTFIRNGDEHDAKKARDHLKMKYDYGKKHIKTAEDFIDKIASQSSLSHKAYQVHCGETMTPAKQWLEEALSAHRAAQ